MKLSSFILRVFYYALPVMLLLCSLALLINAIVEGANSFTLVVFSLLVLLSVFFTWTWFKKCKA